MTALAFATTPTPMRFTLEEADLAGDGWLFNCGAAALCGLLGLTPEQVRPHLGDFESKGYTNPTLMRSALESLGVEYSWKVLRTPVPKQDLSPLQEPAFPRWGFARVQFAGPWTLPGVPMAARYRQTHWVASCRHDRRGLGIFDINLIPNGQGWAPYESWRTILLPALVESIPRADGAWWLTHAVEVVR